MLIPCKRVVAKLATYTVRPIRIGIDVLDPDMASESMTQCPKTGQPDFANILIEYIPDKLCVELKSLKIYFVSFRDKPGFHEDLTNQILDDLVSILSPKYMNIMAEFNVRGGIYTSVNVTHEK